MKATKLVLLAVQLIVLVLFMGIHLMTATPGSSSGNGNPALLLLMIVVPLFIIMVLLWQRIFRYYKLTKQVVIIGLLFTSLHIIAGIMYQRMELDNYRGVIEKALIKQYGYADQQYLLDITSGLTIHVNNQYFNLNTFFMLVSFSVFIALLWLVVLEEKN
ncbi:hypothetical protein ABC382_04235 [Lysinibacillus sp. 1P01SD]|uniref:hypothetical protein n=1 Tax=Lysinibacillus sp. 1P01SD TaxID=3132285 RepID=UPI0039A12F88